MRKEYFIGVDVGASKAKGRGAGVGIVDLEGSPALWLHAPVKQYCVGKSGKPRVAVDTNALFDVINDFANQRNANALLAAIEHPVAAPEKFGDLDEKGEERRGVPIRVTCELFLHYGKTVAVLEQLCEWVFPVSPRGWKNGFGLSSSKAESLELARRTFPGVNLSHAQDHNLAEALLIAEYCRLTELGRRTMAAIKEAQR